MAEITSTRTLAGHSEGAYKEKGSKFLAFALPAGSDEDVRNALEKAAADHPRARHVCYAYRIGVQEIAEFSSDAGEPSGSAGLPVLNAIRSADIYNAIVIVIRYFGGTKLGIPGLIHAYRTAAEDALTNNRIIVAAIKKEFEVKVAYAALDKLYRLVAQCEGNIVEQHIDNLSVFRLEIPVARVKEFTSTYSNELEIRPV